MNLPKVMHHTGISTVTRATSLTLEHVVIMTFMITILKALRTDTHTRRYRTGFTTISNDVGIPNETTDLSTVVLTN